jgi:hypothetical protein
MSLRKIIIFVIVLIGVLFLIPTNPYTDVITKPIISGFGKVSAYLNDNKGLPVKLPTLVEKNKVKKSKVYKWQDKEGNWHFSSTKPPKDVTAETEEYRDDTNVIPTIKPKK